MLFQRAKPFSSTHQGGSVCDLAGELLDNRRRRRACERGGRVGGTDRRASRRTYPHQVGLLSRTDPDHAILRAEVDTPTPGMYMLAVRTHARARATVTAGVWFPCAGDAGMSAGLLRSHIILLRCT